LNPGTSTTVTITALDSAIPGTYTLPINGSGGGVTGSATVNLVIGTRTGPDPRGTPCLAEVTGMSSVTPNLATGQVVGYSYTEVNYCAYSWGYLAGTVAGMFKGSNEYAVSVSPTIGSYGCCWVDVDNGLWEDYSTAVAETSAQSSDGDIYEVVTDHFVVLDISVLYPIGIDAYGDYVYSDPLGFSYTSGDVGPGGVGGTPTDTYDDPGYAYITFSVAIFLGVTDANAFASDATPQIDSISPSSWDPGTTFPVLITGSGFGVSPTLDISPDDGAVHWTINSSSDDGVNATINATFTVDAGATVGDRVVTVTSNGSVPGLGYIAGPGKTKKSNGATVTINGSPCTITIPNDGQIYSLGPPDYRTATIPMEADSNCQGTVDFSLTFDYATTGHKASSLAGPFIMSTFPLNQAVNFYTIPPLGGRGRVTATVTISGVQTIYRQRCMFRVQIPRSRWRTRNCTLYRRLSILDPLQTF
jgi:hypothetical protein